MQTIPAAVCHCCWWADKQRPRFAPTLLRSYSCSDNPSWAQVFLYSLFLIASGQILQRFGVAGKRGLWGTASVLLASVLTPSLYYRHELANRFGLELLLSFPFLNVFLFLSLFLKPRCHHFPLE